jgi:hypothetical protein
MSRLPCLLIAGFFAFVTFANPAKAGEPECGALIKKLQTDVCATKISLITQIQQLKTQRFNAATDADKATFDAQIKPLQQQLDELKIDSPFAPLCEGLNAQPVQSDLACNVLATYLSIHIEGLDQDHIKSTPQSRAVNAQNTATTDKQVQHEQIPARRTAVNKSGTVGQDEPVESLQPISLAGGAFTLAGTRAGTRGVGTVTLNPLALGDPKSVVAGRLLDLSVTTPFALDGSSDQNLRFVGLRMRINATAPISAKPLNDALSAYYAKSGKFADDLTSLLRQAPDLSGCAQNIMTTGTASEQACGGTVVGAAELATFRATSVAAVAAAREEADRYYFGLDARLDSGDPTGTLITGDKGTRLQGALAGGLHIDQGDSWRFQLRGYAGGDYFRGQDLVAGVKPDPVFSVDWGGALILENTVKGTTDKQPLSLGVGVQGRNTKSDAVADASPTNFVNLNLMAIVPAAGGADTGIAASIPLLNSKIPQGIIISFSTDLGLLDGSSTASSGS